MTNCSYFQGGGGIKFKRDPLVGPFGSLISILGEDHDRLEYVHSGVTAPFSFYNIRHIC